MTSLILFLVRKGKVASQSHALWKNIFNVLLNYIDNSDKVRYIIGVNINKGINLIHNLHTSSGFIILRNINISQHELRIRL